MKDPKKIDGVTSSLGLPSIQRKSNSSSKMASQSRQASGVSTLAGGMRQISCFQKIREGRYNTNDAQQIITSLGGDTDVRGWPSSWPVDLQPHGTGNRLSGW